MPYNVYHGRSGQARRVEDSAPMHPVHAPGPGQDAHSPLPFSFGPMEQTVQELLERVTGSLETEDLILLLILYLMYRESGETELLYVMAAMVLM